MTAAASPADHSQQPRGEPTFREVFAFYTMVVGMFLAMLNIQIVGSSFNQIQGGLAASPDEISWLLTAYLIAEVVMIPMTGWLSRVFSTRWLFTACMGGFTAASLGCAMAWDINSMIMFRALQGFFGGAMLPMMFATLFTIFPPGRQETATVIVGMIATTAPALGPSLGGWLSETLSWHWVFLVNVPFGIVIAIIVASTVRFDRAEPGLLRHVDFLGISLAAIALASLLVVLEEGRRAGWFESGFIVTLSVIAAAAFLLFLWRELRARYPLIDFGPFANRNFVIGCFFVFVFGIGLFGPTYMLPLYLARVRDLGSLQIGLIVFVIGCFQVLSGVFVYFMMKVMKRRQIMLTGFILLALGTYLQSRLTIDTGFNELVLPQALRGLASQMCFLPVVNLALGRLPEPQVKNASALFNLIQRLGAGIGIALSNSLLQSRADHHYLRLSEALPRGDADAAQVAAQLRRLLESRLGDSPLLDRAVAQWFSEMAQREALILAFNDIMLITAAVVALSLVALPAIRGLERPPSLATDARPPG